MRVRRPELVVAAAIVLSLPFLPSILDGGLSPSAGLVRFAVALVLCWAVGAIIERVVDTYARQARQAEMVRLLDEARARAAEPEGGSPSDGRPPPDGG